MEPSHKKSESDKNMEKLIKWVREDVNISFAKVGYFVLILTIAFAWNVNAITEEQNFKNTSIKIARYKIFVCLLMFIAYWLIIYQLWGLRRGEKRPKKHRPMPTHMVTVLWFFGIVTVMFQAWTLAHLAIAVKNHCDKESASDKKEGSDTQNINFDIAARYLFESFLLVFILLQTVWIHCLNIYVLVANTIAQRFFYALGSLHVIALNLVIYMKSTLDEAREQWDNEIETATTNGTAGGDAGHERTRREAALKTSCTDMHTEAINAEYMQPIGFAILIETLLTFLLMVYLFSNIEEHEHEVKLEHAVEQQALKNARQNFSEDRMSIARQISGMAENSLSFFARIKLLFHLIKRRSQKFTIFQRISSGIIWALLLLSIVISVFLGIVFFAVVREAKKEEVEKEKALITVYQALRIVLYGILTICSIYCMYYQKRSAKVQHRLKLGGHEKLDLNLLVITLTSVLVFNEFLIQASVSLPKRNPLSTDLKVLQFFDALFCVVQALTQVLLIARALTYKTHMSHSGVSPEFFCLFALMIMNGVMWLVELFERKFTSVFSATAAGYYSPGLWAIVTKTTYPLMIFFHFHSVLLVFILLFKQFRHKKSRWWTKRKVELAKHQGNCELEAEQHGAHSGEYHYGESLTTKL